MVRSLYNNIVAILVYLLFEALQLVVLFGPIVGPLVLMAVGKEWLGIETGSPMAINLMLLAAGLGLCWFYFLKKMGGDKKIEVFFRGLTHTVIRSLGAGDALSD